MKFFLVDNGSVFTYELANKIEQAGHSVRTQKYSPYEPLDPKDANVIILSGGSVNEAMDQLEENEFWFRHEFELIRNSNLPILGLCLGHQIIAVALGATLLELPSIIDEVVNIQVNDIGQQKIGYNKVRVLEHHRFAVDEFTDTGMIELARSNDCVEMLYHPERKLLGVQFHPEIFIDSDSEQFLWDLIGLIHSPIGSHKVA
jgi:anthranilate/para-aminobenzoate synthase component II